MPWIGYCKLTSSFIEFLLDRFHSSDRFRTAINVFGDSIGCAIVQHLSRKELDALDRRELVFVDDTRNNSSTIIPLFEPAENRASIVHASNHVRSITYDNPTFVDPIKTIEDDDDNTLAQTSF